MNLPSIQRSYALSIGLFVTATTILTIQLTATSSIVVTSGGSSAALDQQGACFGVSSMGLIAVAAFVLGGSGTYLLTSELDVSEADQTLGETQRPSDPEDRLVATDDVLAARRQEWEETADRLTNNEETVYRMILDADGVLPQSEIVNGTDLSKATVSRTLDSLEVRNLVERKQRGIENIVLLQ